MSAMPFRKLRMKRRVDRNDLPDELTAFYASYEGCGLEESAELTVRLSRLDEVVRVNWAGLYPSHTEIPEGWEGFSGWQVGISSYLDPIVLIAEAPCCPRGSILTIGPDVAGPGGVGDTALAGSLVLASGFAEWVRHLTEMKGEEYGLIPGGIDDLDPALQSKLRAYYRMLNPQIDW